MISPDTLADLQAWVKGGNRYAEIQIGNQITPEYENIFVYDMDLREGQDVKTVAEINLLAKKQRKLAALKKKVDNLEFEIWEIETGGGAEGDQRNNDNPTEIIEDSIHIEST